MSDPRFWGLQCKVPVRPPANICGKGKRKKEKRKKKKVGYKVMIDDVMTRLVDHSGRREFDPREGYMHGLEWR